MIRIGLIQGVHGVRGEVKVLPLTDFPRRFQKGKSVRLSQKEGLFVMESVRRQGGIYLIAFGGVQDRDAAQGLLGSYLEIAEEEAMALPKDRFYHFQLLGLKVFEDGVCLGEIDEIIATAANDVYAVRRPDGGHFLLPALKSVVQQVDLEAGRMDVALPAGLLEAT